MDYHIAMQVLFKIIFHLMPVVPLYHSKWYFFGASIFLILLFYIKVLKWQKELELLEELSSVTREKATESDKDRPGMGDKEAINRLSARQTELIKLINRWRKITFLPDSVQEGNNHA